jgi:hypothetical protein
MIRRIAADEADQPEEPLCARSAKYRRDGYGCGQAEHCYGISGANGLDDLASQLGAERSGQGDDDPPLGAPHTCSAAKPISVGATVNWARVGRATMIMAIVVAQGQERPPGVYSGRTREEANAAASTTA